MLSQENLDKIVWTGLYKHEPRKSKGDGDDVYWCTNWTFQPVKYNDGTVFMRDTYWGSSDGKCIDLTDDNFSEFEFIFDFEMVRNVSKDIWIEYNEWDKYYAAHDSGGYSCGSMYWIKNGANPSKAKKRAIIMDKIRDLELSIKCKREELEMLDTNSFYK